MISDINIHVNQDLCYACGICVDRCIMDNLRLCVPPCQQACPLRMNCMGYVRLIAMGKQREAAEEMRQYSPFGGILGRICSHPCETECERVKVDGAVNIRVLKRYLADAYPEIAYRLPEIVKETGKQAAVTGSGPAGLMAAFELRSYGHGVTVYEADSDPGGMLRKCIPSYRIPVSEVERAVRMLAEMGILFKTNTALGRDISLDQLETEYDVVILAIGTGAPADLNIPGHDLPGVMQGLDLLKSAKAGDPPDLGKSVVVIGGGNTAMDAALTCRKLKIPDVRIVCLEGEGEMPAYDPEIQQAREAGVVVENCWGPTQLIKGSDGSVEIEFSKCLSVFDDRGSLNPTLEPVCGLNLSVDSVILAVGLQIESKGIAENLFDPRSRLLAADPVTKQSTAKQNVFVCGDCQSGPASVVEAMASGRETAVSADRYLSGLGLRWGRDFWSDGNIKEYESDLSRAKGGPREDPNRLDIQAGGLAQEAEMGLTAEKAKTEAERCLSCGRSIEINKTCWFCLPCEIDCPVQALEVRMPYQVR
jgi:NADPH-dependent glutamate synthase beta subunit-like oxidoreductase